MTRQCPDRSVLRQFLMGELQRLVADEIEEHFANCERCLKAAEQLDNEGALLGAVELRFSPDESMAIKKRP